MNDPFVIFANVVEKIHCTSQVARPKSRNSWYIPAFSVHKLSDVLHKMSVGHFKKMWYIYFINKEQG
jgi:hypothetical protein